jgi:polyisoprenoid-binding protein YceI
MKKLIFTIGLMTMGTTALFAQKYFTRTAKISFDATAKGSPEDIQAVNNEVANIVDMKTGDMVFQVLIKSFKFERALMQEHFNENYMESDKFPKAEFKGMIGNIAAIDLKEDKTYDVKVEGKLTMHGVTNTVSVPGTLIVKDGAITMKAKFVAALADYKISLPGVVADKVGKTALIVIESNLAQK